jgi:hypothetical protein
MDPDSAREETGPSEILDSGGSQLSTARHQSTRTQSPVATTSANLIDDVAVEKIFEITTGSQTRKAVIFVPKTFPNRAQIVAKIVRHGGQTSMIPANSDVALVDEEEPMVDRVSRMYRRLPPEKVSGAVTKKWVYDSILRGEMQDRYDLYRPVRLEKSPEIERIQKTRSIAPAPIRK